MKSWLLCNLVSLAFFVGLNGRVAIAVSQSPESVQAARLKPAPDGQRYLDACDGRPTAILGAGETSCLADYPGELTRGVALSTSAVLFILANLGYGLVRVIRARRRRNTGVHHER